MTTPTLLLIDADILVRAPLAAYLRECSFRVLEAGSGADARKFVNDATVTIDIVLADADLSDESGFTLAAWLREKRPGLEIILAASPEQAAQKAGDLCEGGDPLTKPYDHQLVLDRIRRAIAAHERNTRKR